MPSFFESLATKFLRPTQFLLGVITLAIASSMVHQTLGHTPSQVNYAVFCGMMTCLSVLVLILLAFATPRLLDPLIILIVDGLNMLFLLAGGLALAIGLGVHTCGNKGWVERNAITRGSPRRCHEAQALTVFVWFTFGAWLASVVAVAISAVGGGRARGTGNASMMAV